MNKAQLPKYHAERKKWEAARAARGLPHDEAALDALKMRKIGRVCSSKDMTNDELDDMLAAFLAVDEPDNYAGQIAIAEQKKRRASLTLQRVNFIMLHLRLNVGSESAYVRAIARKTFGNDQYQNLDDVQLWQLEGILLRRLRQVRKPDEVDDIRNRAAEEAARLVGLLDPKQRDGDPF